MIGFDFSQMFGLFDAHQAGAEKPEEDHVFDRPQAFVQAPGQGPLRDLQGAGDLVGDFLQRAKGAEPAAIGTTAPEQQGGGQREPQDEGQRVQKERLPREARDDAPVG